MTYFTLLPGDILYCSLQPGCRRFSGQQKISGQQIKIDRQKFRKIYKTTIKNTKRKNIRRKKYQMNTEQFRSETLLVAVPPDP